MQLGIKKYLKASKVLLAIGNDHDGKSISAEFGQLYVDKLQLDLEAEVQNQASWGFF